MIIAITVLAADTDRPTLQRDSDENLRAPATPDQ
jgi:hypothetical protein